jgi:dihydrofolate synthase / folylpolyglutamate synthase
METSKYSECLHKIFTRNLYRSLKRDRSELNLSSILQMSSKFGNPHEAFDTIHVAGTNGKGSVSLKVARALQSLDYKAGLFTSPHVSCFRERISVNQELISE